MTRGSCRARRVFLQKDWVIQPKSRQLVPGHVRDQDKLTEQDWIIEPSKVLAEKETLLVAKSMCQTQQMKDVVPVEIFNPTDEPIHLYKKTT